MLAALALLATAAASGPTCATTSTLTAESATFTDGSAIQADYAPNQKRCWKVAPACPDDGDLSLHFTRMDLEPAYDQVQVFDAKGELLTKSATTTSTFHSTSLIVWFVSDESVEASGFTATYSCDTLSEEADEKVPLDEEVFDKG